MHPKWDQDNLGRERCERFCYTKQATLDSWRRRRRGGRKFDDFDTHGPSDLKTGPVYVLLWCMNCYT